MEKEKKLKVVFEAKITCPYCKEGLIVQKTRKVIEEATPAEFEERVRVQKDVQEKLQ